MGIVSAIIDSREPEWVQSLRFGDVPVICDVLDAGDLLITCTDSSILGIERKTTDDFLNSLKNDRLFAQLVRLKAMTRWAYLMVCGSLTPTSGGKTLSNWRETGWQWASVQGALLTAQEIGIGVIHVAETEYEQAVIRLAERKRNAVRPQPMRDAALTMPQETILMSLPGIGIERMNTLLELCGTPAWTLEYLTRDDWEFKRIPGIGIGVKQAVRKALSLEESQCLAVIEKEKDCIIPAPWIEEWFKDRYGLETTDQLANEINRGIA